MGRNRKLMAGIKEAYLAGYKDGMKDHSHAVLREDIKYIYGGMCICMDKRKYKQKSILALVNDIQKFWVERVAEQEINPECETVPDMCKRITGIDIMQVFKLEDKEEEV